MIVTIIRNKHKYYIHEKIKRWDKGNIQGIKKELSEIKNMITIMKEFKMVRK